MVLTARQQVGTSELADEHQQPVPLGQDDRLEKGCYTVHGQAPLAWEAVVRNLRSHKMEFLSYVMSSHARRRAILQHVPID